MASRDRYPDHILRLSHRYRASMKARIERERRREAEEFDRLVRDEELTSRYLLAEENGREEAR